MRRIFIELTKNRHLTVKQIVRARGKASTVYCGNKVMHHRRVNKNDIAKNKNGHHLLVAIPHKTKRQKPFIINN